MINHKTFWPALFITVLALISGLTACTGAKTLTTSQPAAQTSVRPNASGTTPTGPRPSNQPGPNNTPAAVPLKTVSGDGTIQISNFANLYFGSAGQIAVINVAAGDQVKKGQVLAKLDTASLEVTLAQSQANLTQVQANIDLAKQNLLQDQASLVKAQQTLNSQQDIQNIQTQIDNANIQLQQTQLLMKQALATNDGESAKYWRSQIGFLSMDSNPNSTYAKHQPDGGQIGLLQKQMSDLLADPAHAGTTLVNSATSVTQIQQYTLAVQLAQAKIVADQSGINSLQANLVTGQKNLVLAQKQLEQATIIAPFDGTVATVYQVTGDTISAPAQSQHPVIYLIDLSTFQLSIGVNELDIPNVKVGQKAKISVDAFPNKSLDGQVSSIVLTPTVQGGIVDYTVTIGFTAPPTVSVMIGMHASAAITIQ